MGVGRLGLDVGALRAPEQQGQAEGEVLGTKEDGSACWSARGEVGGLSVEYRCQCG
jgi:hypothetical protein